MCLEELLVEKRSGQYCVMSVRCFEELLTENMCSVPCHEELVAKVSFLPDLAMIY